MLINGLDEKTNKEALVIFKFSQKQWIHQIINGNLSFSCAGRFMHLDKNSGNSIQGDRMEAVFARLKTDDIRVQKYKRELKNDLEIIPDGNRHVLLRRRSAKLKPIFCYYNYPLSMLKSEDVIMSNGYLSFKHYFDERMFNGFSAHSTRLNVLVEDQQPAIISIRTASFIDRVKYGQVFSEYKIRSDRIDYSFLGQDTFEIPLSDEYDELFFKMPYYEYQHEGRVIIQNVQLNHWMDRLNFSIPPLNEEEYRIAQEPFAFKINLKISK